MKKANNPFISVIVPCFQKEKEIKYDIQEIDRVMKRFSFPFEIIVVVDGMTDKTFENAKKIKSQHVKVYGYATNKGKGYAIRYGMVRSRGGIVGFIDSGRDLSPAGIPMLVNKLLKEDADIVIGSKRHVYSRVKYPLDRKIISWFGQLLIKLLFGLDIKDTQVGMKFFKRKVLDDVLPRLLVKRFAFDIEILAVAKHLGYRKIYEAPVEITYNFESSVLSQSLFKVLVDTLIDTLAIYYRLAILRYYDNGNRRRWKYDPDLDFNINIG